MQLPLFEPPEPRTDDWTFSGAPTRNLTHCYHDYPARMIPQIAAKLLERFAAQPVRLFDPYCGTGTSLVEGSRYSQQADAAAQQSLESAWRNRCHDDS
ncbi:MAG: hypothetical protein DYG88_03315 [Chloroflexi bacterium CFX4]|nr:hypothetical protein [Chloroflexi bacterium CFX4]MDL1922683.1 hypothetical protein [Chloroflexi bacterium CFX3]